MYHSYVSLCLFSFLLSFCIVSHHAKNIEKKKKKTVLSIHRKIYSNSGRGRFSWKHHLKRQTFINIHTPLLFLPFLRGQFMVVSNCKLVGVSMWCSYFSMLWNWSNTVIDLEDWCGRCFNHWLRYTGCLAIYGKKKIVRKKISRFGIWKRELYVHIIDKLLLENF